MMKAIKFAAVLAAATLTVGCATKGDVNNLQSQIDSVKADLASVKTTADDAANAAKEAEAKAASADANARRAAQLADQINEKLDRGFRHGMRK